MKVNDLTAIPGPFLKVDYQKWTVKSESQRSNSDKGSISESGRSKVDGLNWTVKVSDLKAIPGQFLKVDDSNNQSGRFWSIIKIKYNLLKLGGPEARNWAVL